jgi:hypothetical protein
MFFAKSKINFQIIPDAFECFFSQTDKTPFPQGDGAVCQKAFFCDGNKSFLRTFTAKPALISFFACARCSRKRRSRKRPCGGGYGRLALLSSA